MKLYHLKHVPWLDSQLLYHAMPRVGLEGILILAPVEPYVCIGFHQDLMQDVDVAYCQEHDIPIFRREVGGGAVYLDGNQIFYQIVVHKDNPIAHGDKARFYERLLQPVAEAYDDLGVPARYRPINDIITTAGRKISGNGAATIGDYVILVGNLIADFDYESMVHVLRVPDEKFRDKIFKSMRQNLTTLRRETGRMPEWDEMTKPLLARFEKVLGPLEPAALPPAVREKAKALKPLFLSEEWLHKKGRRRPVRDVKIAAGVNVIQRLHNHKQARICTLRGLPGAGGEHSDRLLRPRGHRNAWSHGRRLVEGVGRMTNLVRVHYSDGRAEVRIGERVLPVDRRDNETRDYTCPIELVSAALGA